MRRFEERARTGKTDFSLFFWGNDDAVGPGKYELLLDSARYADSRGFRAVWTPERHFHAFGGPYPNPAVTGAAVAAITSNLDIRAGSCVLPLHHPARVAEEWGVIDNLSNGRVGIAFASGWMPEDFLLRPENAPPHNKTAMLRDIRDCAQPLARRTRGVRGARRQQGWHRHSAAAGQQRAYPYGLRPPEIPTHIVRLPNSEPMSLLTFSANRSRKLARRLRSIARPSRELGRNPSDYTVTLMLHTLVGDDREQVRDVAREPMKAYLRSAVALIKQFAWAFPAFKKPAGIANADRHRPAIARSRGT